LRQVYSPGNANIPLATISSPKDQNKESNSPVSQRERIPSQEENNQLEEKKQDPEDVRDNIDFLRSNEKLDFEEIRRLHRAPLYTQLEHELDFNPQFKKFYQNKRDLFPPLNSDFQFSEAIQSQVTNIPNEARNSLYKLRKTPKPMVKNILPQEPYLKLTVIFDPNLTNQTRC